MSFRVSFQINEDELNSQGTPREELDVPEVVDDFDDMQFPISKV